MLKQWYVCKTVCIECCIGNLELLFVFRTSGVLTLCYFGLLITCYCMIKYCLVHFGAHESILLITLCSMQVGLYFVVFNQCYTLASRFFIGQKSKVHQWGNINVVMFYSPLHYLYLCNAIHHVCLCGKLPGLDITSMQFCCFSYSDK
jgi:hypothetical protein